MCSLSHKEVFPFLKTVVRRNSHNIPFPAHQIFRKPRRIGMRSGNDYEKYFLVIPSARKPRGRAARYRVSSCESINPSCNFFTGSY